MPNSPTCGEATQQHPAGTNPSGSARQRKRTAAEAHGSGSARQRKRTAAEAHGSGSARQRKRTAAEAHGSGSARQRKRTAAEAHGSGSARQRKRTAAEAHGSGSARQRKRTAAEAHGSGSARRECQHCGRTYTPVPKIRGYDLDSRRQGLKLYVDGMNFRRIARHLEVNHQTVINWVNQAAANLPAPPLPKERQRQSPGEPKLETLELDELYTYVSQKKNRRIS